MPRDEDVAAAFPLSIEDFPAFMREITGNDPFPWQSRLARSLAETARFPGRLNLPTASGKTSTILIAVFTMALLAGTEVAFPRRLFFVIDRRIVVDDAYRLAEKLARALAAAKGGILGSVAGRLRHLSGEGDGVPPLAVSAMRGGLRRDPVWAASPSRPAVVVSTVDQVGSRLLFRGYGVSRVMSPVHAGLVGMGSLVLLDEAHLSTAFAGTLRMVNRYAGTAWCETPIGVSPVDVVSITATPDPEDERPAFELDLDDRCHPLLARRLLARKVPRPLAVEKAGDLPKEMAKAARELAAATPEGRAAVVGVICNTVALARKVHAELTKAKGSEAILLTGRSRSFDRDAMLAPSGPYSARIMASPSRSEDGAGAPGVLYVVATQCIEAGADLDFTGLVTELAPLSALRQRFGRLDRLGLFGDCPSVIAWAIDKIDEPNPVYGMAMAPVAAWIFDGDSVVDFGPSAFVPPGPDVGALDPVTPYRPRLLPSHLDRLVRTSDIVSADCDVAPFLHGVGRAKTDVSIIWRADAPSMTDGADALAAFGAILAMVPPSSAEVLEIPIAAARPWFADGKSQVAVDDLDASLQADDKAKREGSVLRWDGTRVEPVPINSLRPGDVLICPAGVGGCDLFGWNPSSTTPVIDIAGPVAAAVRRRPLIRVLPVAKGSDGIVALSDAPLTKAALSAERDRVLGLSEPEPWDIKVALDALASERPELFAPSCLGGTPLVFPYDNMNPLSGFAIARRSPLPLSADGIGSAFADFADFDDLGSIVDGLVDLSDHEEGVLSMLGDCRGLPERVVRTLRLAARHHDDGKSDPRFNGFLRMTTAVVALLLPPVAKGRPELRSPRVAQMARAAAGLPVGFRHELRSLEALEMVIDETVDADLARFLVASHHGHGMPYFQVIKDEAPPPLPMSVSPLPDVATRVAALAFDRCVSRYGWWGAAYLHAMLRLADHRRSAAEANATDA